MTALSKDEAEQVRLRFAEVDTSNVADVLDNLGMPDQGVHQSFVPFPANANKLAGWAYTIHGQGVAYKSAKGDPAKMNACEHLEPGTISVWAGSGEGVCFFGELISLRMKERGCVGALVDGGVHDIAWLGRHQFPVYARYRTPIQSIGRWKVDAYNISVLLPGSTTRYVRIEPGDFILADDDGVISIPSGVVVDVLEKAESLGATERLIREELATGLSLDKALAKYGHV